MSITNIQGLSYNKGEQLKDGGLRFNRPVKILEYVK